MSEFSREVLLARLEAAKVLCCGDDAHSDWLFDTLQAAWEMVNGPVAEETDDGVDGVVVGWIAVDSAGSSEPGLAYFYSKSKPRWVGEMFECGFHASVDDSVIENLGLESSTLYEIRRVPHENMPESAE